MKKIIMSLIMCAASLMASADIHVWNYQSQQAGYGAAICSSIFPIDDADVKGSAMGIYVISNADSVSVDLRLLGDLAHHSLNDANNEITTVFGGVTQRWEVRFLAAPAGNDVQVRIKQTEQFINQLRSADIFCIIIPIKGHGDAQFFFDCRGLPLVWE